MALVVKNPPVNAGNRCGSTPGLVRSSGGGNGNPLQYSYLENPKDRGAWKATVYRVAKSQTGLSDCATTILVTKRILFVSPKPPDTLVTISGISYTSYPRFDLKSHIPPTRPFKAR